MLLSQCVFVHVNTMPSDTKRVHLTPPPPGLELQAVVCDLNWVLESELESSLRVKSALNH